MKSLFLIIFTICSLASLCQENNALLCSDGIDNDNDGTVDCADQECISIPNEGCSICTDGLSFADILIDYQSGCPEADPFPEGALGVADFFDNTGDEPEFVFLGEGGFIKLGFTNNTLSNSGDSSSDLFVFEVGPAVESMSVALRPKDQATLDILINDGFLDTNQDGFFFISDIAGATSFMDLDAIITGYAAGILLFDAIELTDIVDASCGITPGADIDAVCAIYSIDCNNQQFGTAIFNECGDCLEPDDPSFNQPCIDCLGVVDGMAIIDECGECLVPSDPNFNQLCADCQGTPNGLAIIDNCGECLEPTDPSFNQTCIDCEIYIPNIFTPNADGQNDIFTIYSCEENTDQIVSFTIFDRWGNLIFEQNNFTINDPTVFWDGKFKNKKLNSAVFTYLVIISDFNNELTTFSGDVTLIH